MNSVSNNVSAQQAAASSRSAAGGPVNGSGQNRGKFAEHFAETAADDVETSPPPIGGETDLESEASAKALSSSDLPDAFDLDGEATETIELDLSSLDGNELPTNSEFVETIKIEEGVLVVPTEEEVSENAQTNETPNAASNPSPVAAVVVGAGELKNSASSQGEQGNVGTTSAAKVGDLARQRANLKVEQDRAANLAQANGDAEGEAVVDKPIRAVNRNSAGNSDRGLARNLENRGNQASARSDGSTNAVAGNSTAKDAANLTNGQNSNTAGRSDASVNGGNLPSIPGNRGAENRLASMIEASSAFSKDSKITVSSQENPILPATPQQLTISGLSRTVVSQVLETRPMGELELTGAPDKMKATGSTRIIEVQLVPRNLGPVEISIRIVAGRVAIAIETQSAEAERLIKTEVDKIAGAIRQAGNVLEEISVKRSSQITQQSDSLTGDHDSNRQNGAGINQNSNNSMWQSSNEEKEGLFQSESADGIDPMREQDIAAAAEKDTRQGIYL